VDVRHWFSPAVNNLLDGAIHLLTKKDGPAADNWVNLPDTMKDATPTWRPPQIIRPIAIGIIWRERELLAIPVRVDGGAIVGWRPPGGTIEFGERAAAALQRELVEELNEPVTDPEPLSVIENLYTHGGTAGHEVVFVFKTAFVNPAAYARERFVFKDGLLVQEARWIDRSGIDAGENVLLPLGLARALGIPS
jgi:8-oxo-dGTP pyrophosphatase MutT (NUDIX family)